MGKCCDFFRFFRVLLVLVFAFLLLFNRALASQTDLSEIISRVSKTHTSDKKNILKESSDLSPGLNSVLAGTSMTITLGSSTICSGQSTTVTYSWNLGDSPQGYAQYSLDNVNWHNMNAGPLATISNGTAKSISPATTTTYYGRVMGNNGVLQHTATARTITVHSKPLPPIVQGGGTFCNGTTLEAMSPYSIPSNACTGDFQMPETAYDEFGWAYPLFGYYNFSRTLNLVLRSEVTSCEPVLITHIALHMRSGVAKNFTNIQIRLKKTTATTVSTTWDDSGTLVFEGSKNISGTGWHTFELSTPFYWDSQNLLIAWQHNTPYSVQDNYPYFSASNHSAVLAAVAASDSEYPTTLTLDTDKDRPVYRFTFSLPNETIYWQGTTANGTSTSTPSTSQTITESGTYYFRTQTPSTGCWSDAASATVTINKTNAGTISASQEICEGGTPDNLIGTNSSGHSYSWEVQEDCSGEWTAISGANAANYQPTSMNESACFRRKVEAECGTEYSASSSVSSNLKLHYTFNENIEPTYNFAVGEPAPTTSPTGYCSASSNTVEAISYVQFNGIWQASSNTSSSAYIDYTSVSTEVERGQTYATRLMGNTAGDYACGFTVWIDWNRDGVFDSNEMYQCGAISNSTGLDGVVAVSSITVPADAAYGPTRMRVRKNYNAYFDDPCATNSFGQTQDFTVIVKKPMFDPTFESYANGTNPGFTNQLASGSSIVEVSSTRAYQGSKSLRLNRLDGGGNGRVYLSRPINQGDVITYSVYCYSTVAGPRLRIEYNGGDYSWSAVQSSTHTGSGWERLTISRPATTSNTTGYFFMYSPNNNSDTYWDNMQIEKKAHATDFVNGSRNPGYVIDHSGNGNHGTIQAATSPSWTPNGYEAGAYQFDGVATKFIKGNVTLPAQNWTISTWVKKDAHTVQSYPIFVSFSLPYIACNSSTSPFRLSYNSSGGQTNLAASTVPVLGQWYHVVATSDATGTKIYVDGNLEGSSSTVCTSTGGSFDIGRHLNSDTYRIKGGVDDLRIYDKALNAEEVAKLYEGGKIRIDVRPKPDMPTATKSPNVETVCVGQNLTLTGVNAGSGGVGTCNVQYRYSTSGGSSYSSWSSTIPNFVATGSDNRIQIRRKCTGNGCESEINTYVWTVVPDPILSAPTNVSICYGGNATFTSNLSNGTGVQNPVWQYSANGTSGWTNVVAGTPSNSTYSGQATATLAVSGNIPAGTYYYRRHLPATGVGCDATSSVAKLTVTAPPNAGALSGNQAICVSGTTTFTTNGNSGGSWTSSNTSIATVNSSTGLITGVSAGTATITYTVTGTGGCGNATATRTVTVTAPPVAGTISGNQNICEGQTTTFSSNGDAGGVWSSSNTSIATVSSSGLVTGVSSGTATITYTVVGAGGCADATATRTVTVTAPPNAGVLSGNQDICEGQTTTFTSNGDAGGVWSSSAETIATVSSSGVVSGISAGSATITYFVAGEGGCADDETTRTVTVTAPPNAGVLSGTQDICEGQTTTFISNGDAGGVWSSSAETIATVSSSGVVSGISAGSATITYFVAGAGGCADDETTRTVTVTAPPNAGVLSGNQDICVGQTTAFISNGDAGGVWSSSAETIATVSSSGVVSGISAGSATITYFVAGTGGCADDEATRTVTVTAPPNAGTLSGNQNICEGQTTAFTISGNSATGVWSSSNTSIATVNSSGVITGVSSGTATITYTVTGTGGCADDETTRTVTVTAPPIAGTISGNQNICEGQTTTFTSNGDAGGVWSSSAETIATVSSSGVVSGISAGTATITYFVAGAGGCADDETTRTVTVTAPPIAGTISGNQNICEGQTTTFSSNGDAGGVWSSSNTSIATVSSSGLVTGVSSGTATITYTVVGAGGCADATATRTVTVTAPPNAGVLSGNQDICEGQTTTFTSNGDAGGVWSSSAETIATVNSSGVVTGVSAGTATITYFVAGTGGCADDKTTRTVTVTAPPNAGVLSGNQDICEGQTTTFTVSGNSATGVWSSSNTSIATVNSSGVITGVSSGTATITYTVTGTGGCADDETTRTVTVTAPPIAGAISGNQNICEGQTTTFTSNGDAGGVWSSSAETIATVNSSGVVTGVSAGTAAITYFVAGTGGCADDETTRTVTVTAPPNAGVLSGNQEICSDETVGFTSNGDANGVWASSDESVATVDNTGLVTGVSNGSATISYTVYGTGGCADATSTINVSVSKSIAGTISATPSTDLCAGTTAELSLSGNIGSVQWQTNASGSWQNITGETTTQYITPNLIKNTSYRAVVTNGICAPATSAQHTVNVVFPNIPNISGNDYVWTGAIDANWNDNTNKNWLVFDNNEYYIPLNPPSETSNVHIKATSNCFTIVPIVSTVSEAKCNNITIENGNALIVNENGKLKISGTMLNKGSLSMSNNSNIWVKGDWTNSGTFIAGNGTVQFTGSTNQKITTNGSSFNNALLDNSSGFELLDGAKIMGAANFQDGVIKYAQNGSLSFGAGASSNIGNENSYVDGLITKTGSNAFNFATGDGEMWGAVSISASNTSRTITAEYIHETPPINNWNPGYMCDDTERLHHVSGVEYWLLESNVNDNNQPDVTLYWSDNVQSGVHPEHIDKLRVAHWTGSCWENKGAMLMTENGIGSITSTKLFEHYSPITIGTLIYENPLPVELLRFDVSCQAQDRVVSWSTATETNNDYFVVERSTNGISFHEIEQVEGAGNSNVVNNYSIIDDEFIEGNIYYRLKQIDFDGTTKVFDIQVVNCDGESQIVLVKPNPFKEIIEIVASIDGNSRVDIFNSLGKLIHSEVSYLNGTKQIDLAHLKPGVYMLRIAEPNGKVYNFKLVKN